MKKILLSLICCTTFSVYADTSTTFKVIAHNHENAGDESIEIKTDKGLISIYTVNITAEQEALLFNLKKGQCFKIKTKERPVKSDNIFVIMDAKTVNKTICK